MIWLYDNAICDDLVSSFNPDAVPNPAVRVIGPEAVIGLAAQIQNDQISFPIVALSRNDTEVDTELNNFVRSHVGIATVFDKEKNEFYHEKSIPIKLSYDLTVLTTSVADMDEIIKELIFKYTNMYFLTIRLPYESDRKIRFGIQIDPAGIRRSSAQLEYIQEGKLHQSIVPITCLGAVMLSYTPVKLKRFAKELHVAAKGQTEGPFEPYISTIKE